MRLFQVFYHHLQDKNEKPLWKCKRQFQDSNSEFKVTLLDLNHGLRTPNEVCRERVSTGAAGARTRRSLGHHFLHPLFLRLLVLCALADFKVQSSLL